MTLCAGGALLLVPVAVLAGDLVLRTVGQAGAVAKFGEPGKPGLPGLCLEMAQALQQQDPGLKLVGLDKRVPLRRVERMLAAGEIDVFFCLLRSTERERQWRYLPTPLYRVRHMVVQRADDPTELRDMSDLRSLGARQPVLVAQGTVLERRLQLAGVSTASAPSEREAMKMLLLGRAAAIYGQDLSLLRIMGEPGLGAGLRLAPAVFHEEDQWLAVSAQLPPPAEQRLLRALQGLERSGVLKTLAEKYR